METDEVMTISEAADHLKIARASVYAAIDAGSIRTATVLGKRVVYRADVEAYTPRAYTGKRENTRPEGVKGAGGRPPKSEN